LQQVHALVATPPTCTTHSSPCSDTRLSVAESAPCQRPRCALNRQTYAALNALAGHYNSFGTTAPLPKKRLERLRKVRGPLRILPVAPLVCRRPARPCQWLAAQRRDGACARPRQELEDAEKYLGRGR